MIKFRNQVPTVYTDASRDFQYLSWLINVVLNDVKHNIDSLYDLPNNKADPRLTELLAMTLGFKVRRNYEQKQLVALVSIIPEILRYKGTERAIKIAGETLITASGSAGDFSYKIDLANSTLNIILPQGLVDTTLFIDLMPYILPAGMSYRVIRKDERQKDFNTELRYDDKLIAEFHSDLGWDDNQQIATGLAGLYDTENEKVVFSNYYLDDQSNTPILNAGLYSNTIIPFVRDVGNLPASTQDEKEIDQE